MPKETFRLQTKNFACDFLSPIVVAKFIFFSQIYFSSHLATMSIGSANPEVLFINMYSL